MSPIETAINSVQRAVASFQPSAMPVLSRAHYRRELAAWLFLPAMMGAVEGGVVGVLVRNSFEGVVPDGQLNMAVAILAGAPAFANITSFLWGALAHGRHKIRFIVCMQILAAVMVALIALAPHSPLGLIVVATSVVGARIAWSGVVTVRTTVWAMNYPRTDRARLAGKLATVQAVILLLTGLIIGWAADVDRDAFRILYPAAAVSGLIGTWVYSGLRVRGHRALRAAESASRPTGTSMANPRLLWDVLRSDRRFGMYMLCMFVFGTGNLMIAAPLVVILRERFNLGILQGILITSTLSLVFMLISIPLWSRFLDRVHIIRFRAIHSWAFTLGILSFLIGAVTGQLWILYLGAIFKGIAFGGGVLAWNLGHHDFAPPHRSSQYMGVHVTLTGIRGLIAPALGIAIYELLKRIDPDLGPWVFAVCLGLSIVGAIGFVVMNRRSGDLKVRPPTAEAFAEHPEPLGPEEGARR